MGNKPALELQADDAWANPDYQHGMLGAQTNVRYLRTGGWLATFTHVEEGRSNA